MVSRILTGTMCLYVFFLVWDYQGVAASDTPTDSLPVHQVSSNSPVAKVYVPETFDGARGFQVKGFATQTEISYDFKNTPVPQRHKQAHITERHQLPLFDSTR